MRTILTVDDSKVVRTLLALHLKPCGFRVVEAEDGRAGLEAARQHRPDLILLDLGMPVMNGREALAELRKDPTFKSTPVIMLTAESGRDDVVECAKLGVSGYIVKPYKQEALREQVAKALEAAPPAAAPATSHDAPSTSVAIDPHTVLVVDDSERVLALARAALEKTLTVLTATTGAEALEQYRSARPGVVVVDLVMPQMDGFETLARLQGLGRSGYVALAVRGDAAARERARKAGYDAIVEKPFHPDDLVNEVLAAAGVVAPADQLLESYLAEDDGCAVFVLPNPRSKMFGRLLPMFAQKLRALAEDGHDKLILDIAELSEISSDQVKSVVHLVSQADALGIRIAICTPHERVRESLRRIAETQDAPYASSRDAARQTLQ